MVDFLVGMNEADGFEVRLGGIALTTTPNMYTISLDDITYDEVNGVTGGFGWTTSGRGEQLTFYIDDLQWR